MFANLRLRFFALYFVLSAVLYAQDPDSLYLTWTQDPTSTMTVQWHTPKEERETLIYYQKIGSDVWKDRAGNCKDISNSRLAIHTIELEGLESGADYVFHIGNEQKKYHFRTMPRNTDKPVHFVVAGDAYFYLYIFRKMNAQIAKKDPDFVVIGGDIAYTNGHVTFFKGKDWEMKRWGTFFQEWKEQMVTSDGRLIPMVIVLGNHDLKRPYAREDNQGNKIPAKEPLFYELFAMPKKDTAYRALDFGDYLSLILLDTGHSAPIDKEQLNWLKEALSEREHRVNKMAVYHVSAYPSVYRYEGSVPTKIRTYWSPLFEQYGVRTAFENHNHAYKRTHRIKDGKVDPEGVMYLGDGAWGVPPRKPISAKNSWYLAKSAQKNCFWNVTILNGQCYFTSYDIHGQIIEDLREAL
ncbi:MAG TPA: metallophosphoesterase family protein [Rhabdochlamydiaceae bacterium]|nr:metallophosphoesterase family protein [Rhabdochlamydiaceae bacterium]